MDPAIAKPQRLLDRLTVAAGITLIRGLLSTVKFSILDNSGVIDHADEYPPFIFCMWHNRLLAMPQIKERIIPQRRMAVLASASRDGEWLCWLTGGFQIAAIRGSSSRRGFRAMMELQRAVTNGWDIAITPDGPRGPRYEMHSGALRLSQLTGAPIVFVSIEYQNFWCLGTWDGFMIPWPFTHAKVVLSAPVKPPLTQSEDAFEVERSRLEHILLATVRED